MLLEKCPIHFIINAVKLINFFWSCREKIATESRRQQLQSSPLLPKITMVGISAGEAGQMNKATLKKTMEDLTKELERMDPSKSGRNC